MARVVDAAQASRQSAAMTIDRVAMLRTIANKRPSDPFPRYGVAMELRSQGRLDEARAEFALIETDFPTYVPTFLMAGQVCQELGDVAGARAVLQRGLMVARSAGDSHAASEIQSALAALD